MSIYTEFWTDFYDVFMEISYVELPGINTRCDLEVPYQNWLRNTQVLWRLLFSKWPIVMANFVTWVVLKRISNGSPVQKEY